MPRFPKRLLALGGLAVGGVAVVRKRRAGRPTPPSPSASSFSPPAATTAATPPPPAAPAVPATPPPAAAAPDSEILQGRPGASNDDAFVEEEERLAAAEAAGIGGPGPDDAHGDQAFEAVYEGGGGEAEGFELSEEELIENATHGDGRGDPAGDAFTPERESDEANIVDGEADDERVSEGDRDVTDR
ncbi:MAG TPA: hypothetical protein VGM33_19150 [Baekduia sp.]